MSANTQTEWTSWLSDHLVHESRATARALGLVQRSREHNGRKRFAAFSEPSDFPMVKEMHGRSSYLRSWLANAALYARRVAGVVALVGGGRRIATRTCRAMVTG